jgi:diguanylate cyclase (GGDEF)-like protein
VGWTLAAITGGSTRRHLEDLLRTEREEGERALSRLRRLLDENELRMREHQDLVHALPELVRQMFAAGSRREVAPEVVKVLEHLFHPTQAAFFFASRHQRSLVLGAGRGLPAQVVPGFEVVFGEGRIGYVAEHGLVMDESDFRAAPASVRRHLEATGRRGLEPDVVAAVDDEQGLVGVVAISGPRARQGQEKRLLRMVAELAGQALSHVTRLGETRHAADVDGLTGAYNKRYLQRRLGDELHKAERANTPLSLLLLDIDHFKHYNDTNGHLEGDHVLKAVGEILRRAGREDDVVARYGGEEFVIVYVGATRENAVRLAEKLRKEVAGYPFPHASKQPGGAVTLSGGVAAFPEDARSYTDLLRCADEALYEAKNSGRNRIVAATRRYMT